MSRRCIAIFGNEGALLRAAESCRAAAFELVEATTPYPVHGLGRILGLRPSRLPWVTLAGGLAGLAFGTWLQFWASAVDWPLNVGGKPWNSWPAFVPVIFELTVLVAGLATFVFVLLRSGLRPGRKPASLTERGTDDRFALVVARGADSPDWPALRILLRREGALETREETS